MIDIYLLSMTPAGRPLNIIIPIGGKGERFKMGGYDTPKPLIKILGKEMILYVLDNLILGKDDRVFIIYYNLDPEVFEPLILKTHPNVVFIRLNEQTRGAAETISIGLRQIRERELATAKACVLLDCDTYYTEDVLSMYRILRSDINAVFYTKNQEENPIYSYITMTDDQVSSRVVDIQEKVKISDNANTGIYCFADILTLQTYAELVIEYNITFNGEFYTSCIIQSMIKTQNTLLRACPSPKDNTYGYSFYGIELDPRCVFNLGTPQQVEDYVARTEGSPFILLRDASDLTSNTVAKTAQVSATEKRDPPYLFLFDLDGTLVITDTIYQGIWCTILGKYNIDVTEDVFKKYIQGNSDRTVIMHLLPHIPPADLGALVSEISALKDALFLENIAKIGVIPGAVEFVQNVARRGYKIAIVTNCNRAAAEKMVEYIGLQNTVDLLVIGGECKRPKPYPDPDLAAIQSLGMTNDQAIIFEDSKNGIQSGKDAYPKCLVGIETIYIADALKSFGVNISVPDFTGLDIDELLGYNNIDKETIKKYIEYSVNLRIIDIEFQEEKLKGGFISDVIGVKIHYWDYDDYVPRILDCVLKLENNNMTFLSRMASHLNLYEREYYFYNNLYPFVPVKTPKYYGLIKDPQFRNVGVLLENLTADNSAMVLNLDLSKEKIEVSLTIIERLAQMHAKFWNKPISQSSGTDGPIRRNSDSDWEKSAFVKSRWPKFRERWHCILDEEKIVKAEQIVENFGQNQRDLSSHNLTLIHGDVKSANIFYKPIMTGGYEPYFIDWQYVCEGKGVQDLVFFMIESFEIDTINNYRNIFKEYYYIKLLENGVTDYGMDEYNRDFENAVGYFPFFVAIWFGTLDEDELIDKNFPFFFIQKLFNFV